jgi:hypothetical protein
MKKKYESKRRPNPSQEKKSWNVTNRVKKENPVIYAWLASVDIYVGIV